MEKLASEVTVDRKLSEWKFKKGDTVHYNACIFTGFLTSSGGSIFFSIPLWKEIASGLSVSVSGTVIIRHADGGYMANTVTLASLGTIATSYTNNMVFVRVTLTTASTFTNNSVLAVQPTGEGLNITFS